MHVSHILFIRKYGKMVLNITFLVAPIINNFPNKIYASAA